MNRFVHELMTIAAILLFAVTTVRAETIADSLEDWSFDGIQGENNWMYGYYNFTLDEFEGDGEYSAEEFIPFLNDDSFEVGPDGENHWDGSQWRLYRDGEDLGAGLADTGPWTRVASNDAGHPNGANSAAPTEVEDALPEEHWSIRRWVSDHNGPASVEIALTSTHLDCGNGTAAHLFHNGGLLESVFEPNIGEPEEAILSVNLQVGDTLDLALSPEGEDGARGDSCDSSTFHMSVISEGEGIIGDFDASGALDAPDVNDLTEQSATLQHPPAYDLDGDALVNDADVRVWVRDLFNSWVGDANLDGEFNSGDLVLVLAAGTYEIDVAANWSTGDFNGDGRSNSADLVAGLADGGYEQGPRAATAAVPEPSSVVLVLIGVAMLWRRRVA